LVVSIVFGGATLITMCGAVLFSCFGLQFLSVKPLEKYGHDLAGAVMCGSGVMVKVLGL